MQTENPKCADSSAEEKQLPTGRAYPHGRGNTRAVTRWCAVFFRASPGPLTRDRQQLARMRLAGVAVGQPGEHPRQLAHTVLSVVRPDGGGGDPGVDVG